MISHNFHSHIVLKQPVGQQLQDDNQTCGNAEMFEQLLPQLYGLSDKKQQQLQKVDHYMLAETHELYLRLKRFCDALDIAAGFEFKIARQGEGLNVIGDIPRRAELTELINADAWFVDSFIWLQPNYTLLAHSFEVLEFSQYYQQAPDAAVRKYAHLDREDKGVSFALRFQQGSVNAQVETPVNLYCV